MRPPADRGAGRRRSTARGEERPAAVLTVGAHVRLEQMTPFWDDTDAAQLTVCWDGSCQRAASDAACLAHLEATGTKTGFVVLPDLPSRPVEVTVVLADPAGTRIVDQTLTVSPRIVDLPGEDCGGSMPQGRITVGADGKARPAG